ncbi:polysaccharide deacetylase family protein, partial [Streptomyces massasporeus]
MRAVVQNDKSRAWGRRSAGARIGLTVLVLAAIASGCAQDTGGDQVTPAGGQQPLDAPPARALDSYATKLRAAHAARVANQRPKSERRPTAPAASTRPAVRFV